MPSDGIYSFIGMPYSGSTLISFILGSHSLVYGGADLHHLNPERKGVCSVHKQNCPVWTREALERTYKAYTQSIARWYDCISDATGRPYIVDASKQLEFFASRALHETQQKTVLVFLAKHPLRLAASDVYNRLYAKQVKISTIEDIRSWNAANEVQLLDFIQKRLSHCLKHYQEREELRKTYSKDSRVVAIEDVYYETALDNLEETISRLLSHFSLDFNPSFLNYTHFEHHPITGNMAPLWKLRAGGEAPKKPIGDFRKSFYMKKSAAIVKDDKYKELFTATQIEKIESLPVYRILLDQMNYEVIR